MDKKKILEVRDNSEEVIGLFLQDGEEAVYDLEGYRSLTLGVSLAPIGESKDSGLEGQYVSREIIIKKTLDMETKHLLLFLEEHLSSQSTFEEAKEVLEKFYEITLCYRRPDWDNKLN